MDRDYLDQRIRKVPNFPKEGILFYDVTTLFEDTECLKKIIDTLCQKYEGQKIATKQASYEKEYGPDTIEMHEDTIKPGEKVIIADDLLATGGTMLATIDLVKQMGGEIIGIDFIINLSFLPGIEKLKDYPVSYLIDYDNEEVK
jgi:adenine phosphoribosyltransferase